MADPLDFRNFLDEMDARAGKRVIVTVHALGAQGTPVAELDGILGAVQMRGVIPVEESAEAPGDVVASFAVGATARFAVAHGSFAHAEFVDEVETAPFSVLRVFLGPERATGTIVLIAAGQ